MNLEEALTLLKENNYLTELTALPKTYIDKYGKYSELTKNGRKKRNNNITYKDDERYRDHEGTLWLDVKQKDKFTISLATISGLLDSGRIKRFNDSLELHITDIFKLDNIIDNNDLSNKLSKFPRLNEFIDQVYGFLHHYMFQKHTRVYRGIELIPAMIARAYKKDKLIMQSPLRLVKYLDNTTKEFNSFSVDIDVAYNFIGGVNNYILFSGEIDNNDVNWAFTAYLMGRHSTIGEAELNINNIKQLKNIKIEEFEISDYGKDEVKICLKLFDKINANNITDVQCMDIANLFVVTYQGSNDKYIIDDSGKKILDIPIDNYSCRSKLPNYVVLFLKNDKECLLSKANKTVILTDGYDSIYEENNGFIYACNGEDGDEDKTFYVFDETGELMYKTPMQIQLIDRLVKLPDGKLIRKIKKIILRGVSIRYNAAIENSKDKSFIFDNNFKTLEALDTALARKFFN